MRHESEASMRVYGGFTRAILSLAPVGPLAPARGTEAEIAAGLAVYRNNVRAAYLRALHDAFPVTARLVGDEFFRYLAHEYFHAHLPKSPLVARYGDALPTFLQSFELASALPYLADVARLEVAWLQAYHAAEARPLSPEQVNDIIGGDPENAHLTLHPSVRLLSSPYAVHMIWSHNRERNDAVLNLPPRGERVLIARPQEEVRTTVLSADVFAALQALAKGSKLGAALLHVKRDAGDRSVAEVVRRIVTAGIIVSAEISEQGGSTS